MTADDQIERAILDAVAATLRRRAHRQDRIAQGRSTGGDRGAVVRDGEAVIALRLSEAFTALATEFESDAAR
jgi:hypothetical protein